MGKKPNEATKAVMITGRKRSSAFDYNLLYIGHSSLRS
jgi:hypothetical protein